MRYMQGQIVKKPNKDLQEVTNEFLSSAESYAEELFKLTRLDRQR